MNIDFGKMGILLIQSCEDVLLKTDDDKISMAIVKEKQQLYANFMFVSIFESN